MPDYYAPAIAYAETAGNATTADSASTAAEADTAQTAATAELLGGTYSKADVDDIRDRLRKLETAQA